MTAQFFSQSRIKSVREESHFDHQSLVDGLYRLLVAAVWFVAPMVFMCTPAHAQGPAAGISANPTSIAPGGTSTLTWTTQNCTTANINGTSVALNGSEVVSPSVTTTYRITCANSAGQTDWGQVTVTVGTGSAPPPPAAGISANPTFINTGGSSTLTWTTQNCVTANLNGTSVALNGSEVVSPTATTTYRITCANSAGQTDWGQVTVTVGTGSPPPPPAAGISANPTSIAPGGSSTLTWTTKNCTTANINGTSVALNGSEVVSPTTTTTYRITCANSAGQTDWGQVKVTVTGPTATITANPGIIAAGGSSTLTWSSTNATSATLNGAAVAVNGSEVVSPTANTTYTFIATGSTGATATSTVTVSVTSGSAATKGQWAPIQSWPWMAAHAHLLPNGKVLFWPSFANGNNPTLWDPVANTFASAPMAAYNIFCSGHSFLPDGRLLVTGGHNGNSGYGYPYASIYNASQNSWTQIPNMQDARWYPTNTTLPNGDVLVVSGEITPGVYSTLPQVWHPATNSWLNLTSAQLQQPLYPMMLLAPNGQVFNAGPNQTSEYLNTAGTGSWTVVGNFNYNSTRDYGSSVIYDGKVLIVGGGGSGTTSAATNTAEVIDLNASSPKWSYSGSLVYARRQLNLTLLPDGKVLASGGSGGYGFDNQNYPVYAAEMWDPATGQWTTMDSITVYRGYHSTALLLPDGRVVSAGGEQTGASAEIYSPPYLFKGARPSILSGPSSVKYAQQFFVGTPDATTISQVTWIGLGSVTHAQNQNQRLVHLQFTQASGGLNITAPANGNLAPPGYYMLFLVNSNGIPSVAKIIQITN
jgi:Domain of unknown function (DUF1929)/Glyoxal oxidase N-terminus/Galactose oxidase, central domain